MKLPVSIVVVGYEADRSFLSKALPSCVQQGCEEIILVDDGSKSALPQEVEKIVREHGITFVRHGVNRGLSAARNTGIHLASQPFVIPLDADDWFYENAIKKLYQHISEVDIVCGYATEGNSVYKPGIFHGPLSREMFVKDNPIICSSLFRKERWSMVGGYMVRQGPHYEDWNLWARCFASGAKFKAINEKIYNHTNRPDSMLRILHPNGAFYRKLATDGVFTECGHQQGDCK